LRQAEFRRSWFDFRRRALNLFSVWPFAGRVATLELVAREIERTGACILTVHAPMAAFVMKFPNVKRALVPLEVTGAGLVASSPGLNMQQWRAP
jgi:hypothetical protein